MGLFATAEARCLPSFSDRVCNSFIFFVFSHGKAYYMTPIYPTLLAIGAVAVESWLQSARGRRAALISVAVSGALGAPMAIPILSGKGLHRL